VKDYIEIGLSEGANLVVGGEAPDDPTLAGGAYLMPTVFDAVTNDMRIAKEEIFGPVLDHPVRTEAEAISLANGDPLRPVRLGWSRDIGKALRTAKGIQAGVLSVNSNSSVIPRRRSVATRCRASARAGHVRDRAVHRDEDIFNRPAVNGAAERRGHASGS